MVEMKSLYNVGDEGSINPAGLCVVHATQYMPEITPEGSARIATSNTATGGEFFRNTIHVSLNHRVAANLGGNWSLKPYTIIGDFLETTSVNGVPAMLNTVDTFWTRGKGEPLEVPNATIVRPKTEEDPQNKACSLVYDSTDHLKEVTFKTDGFTAKDAEFLYSILPEIIPLHSYDEKQGTGMSRDALLPANVANPDQPLEESLRETVFGNLQTHESKKEARIAMGLDRIYAELRAASSLYATDRAIEERGYHIQPGGKEAWGERRDVKLDTVKLAQQLGTHSFNHGDTPYMDVEQDLLYLKRAILQYKGESVDHVSSDLSTLTAKDLESEEAEKKVRARLTTDDTGILATVDEKTRKLGLEELEQLAPSLREIAAHLREVTRQQEPREIASQLIATYEHGSIGGGTEATFTRPEIFTNLDPTTQNLVIQALNDIFPAFAAVAERLRDALPKEQNSAPIVNATQRNRGRE